jgi:hypothetical protein
MVLMRMGDNQRVCGQRDVEAGGDRTRVGANVFTQAAPCIEDDPMTVERQLDAVAADLFGGTVNRQDWCLCHLQTKASMRAFGML